MGLSVLTHISSLTWKIAVAIITAQLCPRETGGLVPILSELVCWTLVAGFCGYIARFRDGVWKDDSLVLDAAPPLLYWTVAISLSVTALSFSVYNNAWILVSLDPQVLMECELTACDSPQSPLR
jgi:predicted anti-sigma-YlaC factor YlaD